MIAEADERRPRRATSPISERPDLAILDVKMPQLTGLAGDARDPREGARGRGPDPLDARRGALPVRGAEGRRLRLRAQAGGRHRPDRGDPRGRARRALPDARGPAGADQGRAHGRRGREEQLTPREEEVVKLVAEAHTNKEIAELLGLSEKTVENHRSNAMHKLGMRDRVELVRYAIRRGLIEP